MSMNYDLIIVGAGPGGYEAAFEAVKYGMKTALIEKHLVGGTCLNRGCIPTKTIMRSSEAFRIARESAEIGVTAGEVRADLDRIIKRKEEVSFTLREGILGLIRKKKIDLYTGSACVTGPNEVRIALKETQEEDSELMLTADRLLIATGSVPAVPPIPGRDLPGVMTSDDLLERGGEIMKELVIIGGGVIGIEFATIYHALGTKVTVIEALDRLLPAMDKELGRSLKMNFSKRGIDCHTGARVEKIEERNGRLVCFYTEKGKTYEVPADGILVSTGRKPATQELFVPEIAEQVLGQRGYVEVNEHWQTAVPSIYAIGDVIGGVMLAHVATAEGRNAVAIMSGQEPAIRMDTVAGCIYTDPEIAEVGMTQDAAKEAGIRVITKKFPMSANGKTVIEQLDRGFIKLVAREEDHVLIGAQLMCGRATDIIGELSLAVANGLTVEDVANTIHPHPTFTEAVCDAARA
ncbi:MAG: dihydrolipoyl dehydrogenase [Mogibacterium sp.]|nr:dihydrolipoyl dehydrogenase [Mogibacterium sp.]